jgi:hypothetical protein
VRVGFQYQLHVLSYIGATKSSNPISQLIVAPSMQLEISEICISGIATYRKHSLPTHPNVERKREHGFIRIFLNKILQTINEKENPWGYRFGTFNGKTI